MTEYEYKVLVDCNNQIIIGRGKRTYQRYEFVTALLRPPYIRNGLPRQGKQVAALRISVN